VDQLLGAVALSLSIGCASRSALHASDAGVAETAIDAGPETWGVDASGAECLTRPTVCPRGDFGAIATVTATYEECAKSTPACGDLTMVFDAEGCLVRISEISEYPATFVECVERAVSANRWLCADNKNLHMAQACAP